MIREVRDAIDPVKGTDATFPPQFKNWDTAVVDEVMPTRDHGRPYPLASSDGIGRNVRVSPRRQ